MMGTSVATTGAGVPTPRIVLDSSTLNAGSSVLTVCVRLIATAANDRLAAMWPTACIDAGPSSELNSSLLIGCARTRPPSALPGAPADLLPADRLRARTPPQLPQALERISSLPIGCGHCAAPSLPGPLHETRERWTTAEQHPRPGMLHASRRAPLPAAHAPAARWLGHGVVFASRDVLSTSVWNTPHEAARASTAPPSSSAPPLSTPAHSARQGSRAGRAPGRRTPSWRRTGT